jgi:hypothetical protein
VTISTLFPTISGAQAVSGVTIYRCVYVRNEDSNADGLQTAVAWLFANTTSADTALTIGLDLAGKNAAADTIADSFTAPDPAVTFIAAATAGAALSLGTLSEDDYYAIWLKLVVDASASADDDDTFTLRVGGDSSAGE